MKLIVRSLIFVSIISVLLYIVTLLIEADGANDRSNLLVITDTTGQTIKDVVDRDTYIVGIQIVTVDFKHNRKIETYAVTDIQALNEIYRIFIETSVVNVPLFREDNGKNRNILRLMNGEFVCVPFKESSAYRYAPQAEMYVKYVCGIAIPPNQYNNFSGILTLYLNNTPSEQILDELFIFARSTSLRIAQDNENIIKY